MDFVLPLLDAQYIIIIIIYCLADRPEMYKNIQHISTTLPPSPYFYIFIFISLSYILQIAPLFCNYMQYTVRFKLGNYCRIILPSGVRHIYIFFIRIPSKGFQAQPIGCIRCVMLCKKGPMVTFYHPSKDGDYCIL